MKDDFPWVTVLVLLFILLSILGFLAIDVVYRWGYKDCLSGTGHCVERIEGQWQTCQP